MTGGLCGRFAVSTWAFLGREPDAAAACSEAGFAEATVRAMASATAGGGGGGGGGGGARAADVAADVAELVQEACRAFATLAFGDGDGRALLREAGVEPALTRALDAHPHDMKVQEMGRSLLSELAR